MCTAFLAVHGRTVQQIFGSPDDLKLRSCMTLFELAAPEEPVFGEVLDRYYGGYGIRRRWICRGLTRIERDGGVVELAPEASTFFSAS